MALYDEVVNLAKGYLGPSGKKFVDRQISGHLNIEGPQLKSDHLDELAKWCRTSGKLMMDPDDAQEFSEKVKALK